MPAALPAKRKIHHVPAASNVSAATSSKKLKPDLTCTVCSITATSETAMQEHLKGKSHGRKTAKLALALTGAGQHEVKESQYTHFIQHFCSFSFCFCPPEQLLCVFVIP
jgi:hypothetical protein